MHTVIIYGLCMVKCVIAVPLVPLKGICLFEHPEWARQNDISSANGVRLGVGLHVCSTNFRCLECLKLVCH